MKKKYFILAIFILLLTTGCAKKLTCTIKEDEAKQKVVVKFKKDKAESVRLVYRQELPEKLEKDEAQKRAEEMEKYLTNEQGYEKASVKVKDKYLEVDATVNAKDYFSNSESFDDTKKSFEDQGFTCK